MDLNSHKVKQSVYTSADSGKLIRNLICCLVEIQYLWLNKQNFLDSFLIENYLSYLICNTYGTNLSKPLISCEWWQIPHGAQMKKLCCICIVRYSDQNWIMVLLYMARPARLISTYVGPSSKPSLTSLPRRLSYIPSF